MLRCGGVRLEITWRRMQAFIGLAGCNAGKKCHASRRISRAPKNPPNPPWRFPLPLAFARRRGCCAWLSPGLTLPLNWSFARFPRAICMPFVKVLKPDDRCSTSTHQMGMLSTHQNRRPTTSTISKAFRVMYIADVRLEMATHCTQWYARVSAFRPLEKIRRAEICCCTLHISRFALQLLLHHSQFEHHHEILLFSKRCGPSTRRILVDTQLCDCAHFTGVGIHCNGVVGHAHQQAVTSARRGALRRPAMVHLPRQLRYSMSQMCVSGAGALADRKPAASGHQVST